MTSISDEHLAGLLSIYLSTSTSAGKKGVHENYYLAQDKKVTVIRRHEITRCCLLSRIIIAEAILNLFVGRPTTTFFADQTWQLSCVRYVGLVICYASI